MRDYGFTMDRATSDRRFDRYVGSFRQHGFTRFLVETHAGEFLGYAGIMAWYGEGHPIGDHEEIGWRFLPETWGNGYATEAAQAVIADGYHRLGLERIIAYTAPDNLASQGVMARLSMQRDVGLDFEIDDPDVGHWTGLVWVARRDPENTLRYGTAPEA